MTWLTFVYTLILSDHQRYTFVMYLPYSKPPWGGPWYVETCWWSTCVYKPLTACNVCVHLLIYKIFYLISWQPTVLSGYRPWNTAPVVYTFLGLYLFTTAVYCAGHWWVSCNGLEGIEDVAELGTEALITSFVILFSTMNCVRATLSCRTFTLGIDRVWESIRYKSCPEFRLWVITR